MDLPIVLDANLFPVQAFFNAMPESSLISTLKGFACGIGAGFNDAVCEFPEEIETGDEVYAGVKFYIFDEELVISNENFFLYLKEICSIYLAKQPNNKNIIENVLMEIAGKLSVAQLI